MKGGMQRRRRRGGRKREPMGWCSYPDCGLCMRHSRGCGPAVADQLINGSIWSCRPQVAGSRTFGAGTNCGSATDKITACIFLKYCRVIETEAIMQKWFYVGRAIQSNLNSPWRQS